jgi:CxxC motif-containing protein
MTKNITCTRCPMGCTLTVTEKSGILTVTGQGCPRGEEYGRSEYTCPVRTLTTTAKTACGRPIPVKTASPIPKEKLFEAMELVNRLEVSLPVRIGDVLMEDLFGTKLVATANAE